MKKRLPLLCSLAALVGSLLLNLLLYREVLKWHGWFNQTRLNPLGLGYFDEEMPVPDDQPLIVFFGDSRARAWPDPTLEQVAFANRGIDGHTSAQSRLRFESHVASLEPEVLVLQVGINDLVGIASMPGQQAEITNNTIANIGEMVARSRALGTTVVLTTIFPTGHIPLNQRPFWSEAITEAVNRVNDAIYALEGDGVVVFDTGSVLADARGYVRPAYAADELHLNEQGYVALNEALLPILSELVQQ